MLAEGEGEQPGDADGVAQVGGGRRGQEEEEGNGASGSALAGLNLQRIRQGHHDLFTGPYHVVILSWYAMSSNLAKISMKFSLVTKM
jgi:hypothetical protein